MPDNVPFEVTLQDLRAIIHGLKMASFSFVEKRAMDDISSMIKSLPGPEELNALDAGQVKNLQNSVGKIMRLIELYGKRDMEYKTRYKSRTGLPPRYKVLDWRVNMQQKARNITRGIIKTSAVADNLGYSDIAEKLIKCAKKIKNDDVKEVELAHITADTIEKMGLKKQASLIRKTAQTIELGIEDITGNIQQIFQAIENARRAIEGKRDSLANIPTAKNALKLLGKLWNQLGNFKDSLVKPVQQLQQQAPEIEQALESTVPKSVFDTNDRAIYEIEWSEPNAQGEQEAYITKSDGNKYEVMRDENGKMSVSPTPMASEQPQPQPQQVIQPQQPAQSPPETAGQSTSPQPGINWNEYQKGTPQGNGQSTNQQSTFSPGTDVQWTTTRGNQQMGKVKGPSPTPGHVIVEVGNGQFSVPEKSLQRAASNTFNLKRYSSMK